MATGKDTLSEKWYLYMTVISTHFSSPSLAQVTKENPRIVLICIF